MCQTSNVRITKSVSGVSLLISYPMIHLLYESEPGKKEGVIEKVCRCVLKQFFLNGWLVPASRFGYDIKDMNEGHFKVKTRLRSEVFSLVSLWI